MAVHGSMQCPRHDDDQVRMKQPQRHERKMIGRSVGGPAAAVFRSFDARNNRDKWAIGEKSRQNIRKAADKDTENVVFIGVKLCVYGIAQARWPTLFNQWARTNERIRPNYPAIRRLGAAKRETSGHCRQTCSNFQPRYVVNREGGKSATVQ